MGKPHWGTLARSEPRHGARGIHPRIVDCRRLRPDEDWTRYELECGHVRELIGYEPNKKRLLCPDCTEALNG